MIQRLPNGIAFTFFSLFSSAAFCADVVLPAAPVGSSFYILPGVYGAVGDNFLLTTTFNAPNGNIGGGLPAVAITGASTFTLTGTGVINQNIGGSSGVTTLRAIIIAKAGATIINQGELNGISDSAVENTFGIFANSVQSGLPTKSSYAYNYGTINMQGASTDGMHAAGTTAVRSYVYNYGTINVQDRVTGVSSWVEGMSATGNGAVINGAVGIINADSKAGSRGSGGLFGGFNQSGFVATSTTFGANDPQMLNQGTVNATGDSHGFYYWGNFATYGQNDATVTVTGRGHGVYLDNVDNNTTSAGSQFRNSSAGTITTSSDNSYGVYLRFTNNTAAFNAGTIETNGAQAHGIVAYSSGSFAGNLAGGTITTNGATAAGIYYSNAALNNTAYQWNLGTININGANSFGIATPQSIFRNDGIINVNGANSFGMLAGGSYDISPDGTIPNNTYLGGLTPLSASQGAAQTAINVGVINASAATTIALAAQGVGSMAANAVGATINAINTGTAMLARSGAAIQNFGSILVGTTSTGMLVQAGSVGLNGGNVQSTNGTSASVTSGTFLNLGSIISNTTAVAATDGSTISSSGIIMGSANAVEFTAGNNSLNLLTGSVTSGNVVMGSGADVTNVFVGANINSVSLFNGTSNSSTLNFNRYDGIAHNISGWNEVNFLNDANVIFDGSETHSANLFTIDDVSTLRFSTLTGTIVGDVNNAGILNYTEGSGSGAYTIQGNVTNSGLIALAGVRPGSTLSIIGNYTGQNGLLGLNSFLGGDNSISDQLILNGGVATGSTGVAIASTAGLGAPTFGNGILVINAINGGATNPSAFYLSAPVVAGPFEYYLVRGSRDGSDPNSWYLRSTLGSSIIPSDDPAFYRREVSLAAAIPSVALLYDQFILGTLHQRVGEQEQINHRQPPQAYLNGMWIRAIQQNGTFNNNTVIKSGPSFTYYFSALQLGVDVYHAVNSIGSNFAGLLGTFGKEHGSVNHMNFLTAGHTSFDAWTLGGYFTHYNMSGWYIDNVLSATFHQINANSDRGLPSLLSNGYGVTGSVESGYSIGLPYGFSIEPEIQAVVERLSLNNSRDTNTVIGYEPTNSVIGRIGGRVARTWELAGFMPNVITGWLFDNVWHQFQGNSRITFTSENGNIPFSSNLSSTANQIGVGLTARVSKSISVYGTGSYTSYASEHGYTSGAELGVRFNL